MRGFFYFCKNIFVLIRFALFVFCCLTFYTQFKAQTNFPYSRFVDWQHAGSEQLDFSTAQIIHLDQMGIDASGQADCSALVNQIIQTTQNQPTIIRFPAGTFYFTNSILLRSHIAIEGAGAAQTFLRFNLNQSGSAIVGSGTLSNTTYDLAQVPLKNQQFLRCNNQVFQAGDWIRISCADSALVSSTWAYGTVGQLVQIVQVAQDTLFLAAPLRRSYIGNGDVKIQKMSPLEHIQIKCLSIERIDDTAPAQESTIQFNYVVHSEISHLASKNCTFAHVDLRTCSNISVKAAYFQDAFSYGGGGRAYGVVMQATTNACLVEDNIFKHLRHAILLQSGANGNVSSFNYSTDAFWSEASLPANSAGDLVLHGNYVYANLFEQNEVGNIVIDNSHGANGPDNLFYRNRATLYGIFFSDQTSPNQLFIGNHVTNTAFPYSLINYTIQGVGHYQFANNNKGTIVPAGTVLSSDSSFAYQQCPNFVPLTTWLTIGDQPVLLQNIPAKQRYNAQQFVYNNCEQTAAVTFSESITGVQIWPNPAQDEIQVRSEQEAGSVIEIYSVNGKLIHSQQKSTIIQGVSIRHLDPGMYYLKFSESLESFPFVKE